jgi:hypothetical protein
LKWLIGGGGLVTALAPGVIGTHHISSLPGGHRQWLTKSLPDDWPSPSDEGEDALDYLRKWVELVETAHLTASKLFGIKMLSRFSRDGLYSNNSFLVRILGALTY